MARPDAIEVEGEVMEFLPNHLFRVVLPNGHVVIAYFSRKMQLNGIPILPGQRVMLELTPYDLSKGKLLFCLP